MAAHLHFYDGIPTTEIHQVVINATKSLISLRNTDYSSVAARLIMQGIYREVYGDNIPLPFKQSLANSKYRPELLTQFSPSEHTQLAEHIDYSRDFNFTHSGIEQLLDKYCIYADGRLTEAPQDMFMAIAMDAFYDYPTNRMQYIMDMYDALSTFQISLPTPMMRALRTPSTDYASCVLVEVGDSIDSWTAGSEAIIKHTTSGAGVGFGVSNVATIGDSVKNGAISHAGKIPLLKYLNASINAATQNGRRGSGTAFINFFDPEIMTILGIKSPRTEVNKRIQELSYGVKLNKLFFDRIRDNGVISLFSPRQHKQLCILLDSDDIDGFIELYEQLEQSNSYHSQIAAREFAEQFVTDVFEQSSHYLMFSDNVNTNTPYKEPITQSNICTEIMVSTKPVSALTPDSPDIGVCILSNVNQAAVHIDRLPHVTNLLVRMLNNVIPRQVHPTPQANAFVRDYAALGVGFSNHAYWLAANGWLYGNPTALRAHDEWMEHFQFGLLTASCNVAKEFGPAPMFDRTTYSDGIMPFHRCTQTGLVPSDHPSCEWKELFIDIKQYGLANTSLSSIPPSETSSVVGGQTASLDPIKKLITIKDSKTTTLVQLAPEAYRLADKYDIAYDRPINRDYLKHVAVTQAWIDQSISAVLHYNPELYPEDKIPMKEILSDWAFAHKFGVKAIYYVNTKAGDSDDEPITCAGGGCSV